MAKLNRWHDWLVIESMVPTGRYTDERGNWAQFDVTYKRRWFFFLHPGYWWSFIAGNLWSRPR